MLNCVTAALTHMYTALGRHNPMHDPYVKNFVVALVKSGTHTTRVKSRVIPVHILWNLLMTWPCNEVIDMARCYKLKDLVEVLQNIYQGIYNLG